MKKKFLIGCKVLKKEIEKIITEHSLNYDCVFLAEQLHNTPEVLQTELKREIDAIENTSEIIIAYGRCGNALIGIGSESASLVMPKYDDCIQMLLCKRSFSVEKRRNSYFGSNGWLLGKEDLGYEYDRMKIKFGEKRALKITQYMFKNYKYLTFIKTKVEDEECSIKRSQAKAEKLGLIFDVVDGDLGVLEGLLTEKKDNRYIVIKKHEIFTEKLFLDAVL